MIKLQTYCAVPMYLTTRQIFNFNKHHEQIQQQQQQQQPLQREIAFNNRRKPIVDYIKSNKKGIIGDNNNNIYILYLCSMSN